MISWILYSLNILAAIIFIHFIWKRQKLIHIVKWQHAFQSIRLNDTGFIKIFLSIPFDIMYKTLVSPEQILVAYAIFLFFMIWFIFQFCINHLLFLLIAIVILLAPLIILENKLLQVREHVDQNFLGLMHAIHAGLLNTEDIIAALSYASDMIDDIYVKRMLEKFNRYIQIGLSENKAFRQLRSDCCHEYLSYVFMNIEQVYNRRGNIIRLIENLQLEYTAIQIELNKRRIELKQEKALVISSLCVMLGVAIYVQRENNYIWRFYEYHGLENFVTLLIILTVFLTLYVLIKSDRLRY